MAQGHAVHKYQVLVHFCMGSREITFFAFKGVQKMYILLCRVVFPAYISAGNRTMDVILQSTQIIQFPSVAQG